MRAIGLPARVAYAGAAFVLSGTAVFYSCMHWLPEYTASYPALDGQADGYGIFKLAIGVAALVALTLSLLLLTMPGVRHRKRLGRGWRIGTTAILVMLASLFFADEGFGLGFDLLFAAWLAYMMAFTFVRYGVTDEVRRSSRTAKEY